MVLEKKAIQEAIDAAFKQVLENIFLLENGDQGVVDTYTAYFPILKETLLKKIEQRSIFQ